MVTISNLYAICSKTKMPIIPTSRVSKKLDYIDPLSIKLFTVEWISYVRKYVMEVFCFFVFIYMQKNLVNTANCFDTKQLRYENQSLLSHHCA